MPSSPPAALPIWLRPAILVLAAILLMACFSTEVTDSDTWLHLETGKYVVEHHQIPYPIRSASPPIWANRCPAKKPCAPST